MAFHVLAHIQDKDTELVKYCYEKNLQSTLLSLIPKLDKYDVSEVCSFLTETLPDLNSASINNKTVLRHYYQYILTRFSNVEEEIEDFEDLMIKIAEIDDEEFIESICSIIVERMQKNIMSGKLD